MRKSPIIDQFVFPSLVYLYKRWEENKVLRDGEKRKNNVWTRLNCRHVDKNKVQIELSCSHILQNPRAHVLKTTKAVYRFSLIASSFHFEHLQPARVTRQHLWVQKWEGTGQNDRAEQDQSVWVARRKSSLWSFIAAVNTFLCPYLNGFRMDGEHTVLLTDCMSGLFEMFPLADTKDWCQV